MLLSGKTVSGAASARAVIDGRAYINFFGSGYLALTNIPEVRDAARKALDQGVPFSRHYPAGLGIRDPFFDAVEGAAALACGTEASVYFASGYLVGAVGVASLAESCDLILIDEAAHYSLKDAARVCGLPTYPFAHRDPSALEEQLRAHVSRRARPLLLTDGVFATMGQLAPLKEYASLLEPFDGRIFVDESHAFGVVGPNGRGAADHCEVGHVATIGSTLGKALCAQGAVVGCCLSEASQMRGLPPIRGACAGSPISAAVAAASLTYVRERPELRAQLAEMTAYFRGRLRQIGFDVVESPAPIVSFAAGRQADMQALQRRLWDEGILIYHSTYLGAGPEGVIRCAVFRDHCRADIDSLIAALKRLAAS